ncbi:hypothetical protein, partial [Methylobacterium sp. WL19]|uniref:hypothetical protein n=1 Tax=Methylobacterium sp. WL19 TaxID=2603896 RepID=UPI001AED32AD
PADRAAERGPERRPGRLQDERGHAGGLREGGLKDQGHSVRIASPRLRGGDEVRVPVKEERQRSLPKRTRKLSQDAIAMLSSLDRSTP